MKESLLACTDAESGAVALLFPTDRERIHTHLAVHKPEILKYSWTMQNRELCYVSTFCCTANPVLKMQRLLRPKSRKQNIERLAISAISVALFTFPLNLS